MADDIVIRVDGLWKRYGLPVIPTVRRYWRALCNGRDASPDRAQASAVGGRDSGGPWALKDINLEVRRGETLGVIGRNGAGKSTLLKVLAGVTPPTRGRMKVQGRVFPMIELNAGLHPELTGQENVRLLGAIMGLSRREIQAKMPKIEQFCELGEWFHQPVRMYSSGMLARLGFGVAMYVDADILLVDEVLAVGDFAFQKKCVNRMTQLCGSGATMLFVSHNPYMIERMCDRAVLLRSGNMQELGDPSDVIHRYFEMITAEGRAVPANREGQPGHLRPGTGDLRIQKVEILDATGQPATEVFTGEPVAIRLYYEATEPLWEPNFSIRIFDPQSTLITALDSTVARKGRQLLGNGHVECLVDNLSLMPNIYTVQVKVAGDVLLDFYDNAMQFNVRARGNVHLSSGGKGLLFLDANWRFSANEIATRRPSRGGS